MYNISVNYETINLRSPLVLRNGCKSKGAFLILVWIRLLTILITCISVSRVFTPDATCSVFRRLLAILVDETIVWMVYDTCVDFLLY